MMVFHFKYLYEALGTHVRAMTFLVEIDDPARGAEIGAAIDALFENSTSPTLTESERTFTADFMSMAGDLGVLINGIGLTVCFAILLVTANAMMMSARERTGEIAVLKTVGFSDKLLFALVMVEAGAMALTGAALGLGFAKLLYPSINFNGAGFLPDGFAPRVTVSAVPDFGASSGRQNTSHLRAHDAIRRRVMLTSADSALAGESAGDDASSAPVASRRP